jgi:hypothetical protein
MRGKEFAKLDDISPYLTKRCVPDMLKPLLELVNTSVREDIFPSIVQLIYTEGTKEDANI